MKTSMNIAVAVKNALTAKAVAATKAVASDYFKTAKPNPKRVFARYFSEQDEDTLKSHGFISGGNPKASPVYNKVSGIALAQIRTDESLQNQDRTDLDSEMIRHQTMQSFAGNDDAVDSPALVLRDIGDGTYDIGDGRHRAIFSNALGCETVNAFVVQCDDEAWDNLRFDFNNRNGQQRSLQERLLLVYNRVSKGGCVIRNVCQKNGVSYQQYNEFAKSQKLRSEAKDAGLNVAAGASSTLVKCAIDVAKKNGVADAQKVLNASQTSSQKTTPSKAALDKILKPIYECDDGKVIPDDTIAATIQSLRSTTIRAARGGREYKDYATRFRDHLKAITTITGKTSSNRMDVSKQEKQVMIQQVSAILAWLHKE